MQAETLFEPAEYLDEQSPGYFSVLAKPHGADGRAEQHSYELHHLPTVVRGLNPAFDTWISQASFSQPNRRAVNLESVGLLFCDLDTYNVPNLANRSAEEQANLLVAFCIAEEIPTPSIILFSGRGLQAKWLLTHALGPVSLYDWNSVQLALVKTLEPFAADVNSRDVSRVLRLENTVNTKSGQKARVVYVTGGVEDCPARYDFQDLRELFEKRYPTVKERPAQKQEKREPRILSLPQDVSFKRLNWCRLNDIRNLWELRGGVPVGYREVTLFWELNFLLRAEPGRLADIWKEAEALAGQIGSSDGWYRNYDVSTLYRKAREARNGLTVEFHGREYPPLYTPRNQTLIDTFRITADEERQMKTIISQTEKYRREMERRRAAGVRERSEYLSGSIERQKPWEAEGISRRTWYYRRKKRCYPQAK